MADPIPDANQASSSQATDATQAAPSPATQPTSDAAYQSGLQAAINKGLGQTIAPSQRAEEPAPAEPQAPAVTAEGETQTPPPEGQEPPAEPKQGEEGAPADPNASAEEGQGPVPYARFSEVVEEKNSALEQVKQLEPAVRDYQQILGFIEHNQLTAEDFQWAMRLVAAKRNSPDIYLQMLQPDIDQLGQMSGAGQLDADLKAAVEASEISPEWAQKVQASRAKDTFQQQSAQARMQAQQRQQFQTAQAGLTNAIMDWSKTKQGSDTEFQPNKKGGIGLYETFAAHLRMAAEQQVPGTPEQMKAMCEKVYAQVKPLFRSLPPRTNGVHVRTNQTTTPRKGSDDTLDGALTAAVEKSNRQILQGRR